MRDRFLFFVVFVVLFLIPTVYFGSLGGSVSDWVASYWHVNYTYGFVRRGLVGTLALPFGDVKRFAFWSTFMASILMALIFTFLTEDRRLWLLFLLSPATALHLGFDVGRYDHFNLLLMAVSLLLIKRERYLYVIPPLTALGVLVHEAYVIYAVPVLTAILWLKSKRVAILNGIVAISLVFAVVMWGNLSPQMESYLLSRPEVIPDAIEVLSAGVKDTIFSNLSYILGEVLRRPWDFLLPILILSGYTVVYLHSARDLPPYVRMSPFTGLLLFLLGYDYPRWVSIMVMLLLFLMAFSGVTVHRKVRKLSFLLMATTLLGPLGAGHYAFPILEALIFGTPPY